MKKTELTADEERNPILHERESEFGGGIWLDWTAWLGGLCDDQTTTRRNARGVVIVSGGRGCVDRECPVECNKSKLGSRIFRAAAKPGQTFQLTTTL